MPLLQRWGFFFPPSYLDQNKNKTKGFREKGLISLNSFENTQSGAGVYFGLNWNTKRIRIAKDDVKVGTFCAVGNGG